MSSKIRTVTGLLTFVIGLYGFYYSCFLAGIKFQYPYALNLGEAPLSQAVRILFEGHIPYKDLSVPPFSLVPYGPVYLVLAALMRCLFNDPFISGRVVSFIAALLAGGFLFGICHRSGVKFFPAALAFFLFGAHPYVRKWGVQVNVDVLAVMFSLASAYFFIGYIQKGHKDWRPVLGGGVIALVAFFTKASAIACPAAFVLYCLTRKQWRTALVFSMSMALAIGALYGGLNIWTQGQYYFQTTYEISQRLFFPEFIFRYWLGALKVTPLLIGVTLFFLVRPHFFREHRFIYFYLLLSVLETVSLGKQGSETNYFLEWCAISALALAFILERWMRNQAHVRVVLVLAILSAQLIHFTPRFDLTLQGKRATYVKEEQFYDKISKLILKTPGPIISWDMSLLVANGREVYYECFPMAQMSYSGVWDESPIIRDLNNKKFGMAILYFYAPALRADRNFTEGFLRAFKANYHFIGRTVLPGQEKRPKPHNALFFYAPNE